MLHHVLIAMDNAPFAKKLRSSFTGLDAVVRTVRTSAQLWKRLSRDSGDFIVVSPSILQDPVETAVKTMRDAPESPSIVAVTAKESPEERARLLAAGCDAVLSQELPAEAFVEVFRSLFEKRREASRLKLTARILIDEPRLSDFVSESASMKAFMETVERVVEGSSSLLILGETGVGKERLARAIHTASRRSMGPFIAVNCAALPETLLESELFGHEEGAFTGAARRRRGWFEMAHGGTVFLDEIGEMPLHMQVKILRVLQDREICPLGSERTIPIDVRVVAATNRDLEEQVKSGGFRQDLYYRLSVIMLTLPPLRERREDIPVLAGNYCDYYQAGIGRSLEGIDPGAMEALVAYSWPGNVRELANVIERAVLLCRTEYITPSDLPDNIARTKSGRARRANRAEAVIDGMEVDSAIFGRSLRDVRSEAVARAESSYLTALLRKTRGRVGRTAKLAGIQPRSLHMKMKRYGLRKEDFRSSSQ
jgi:DNA-binding NtrC family response regulator